MIGPQDPRLSGFARFDPATGAIVEAGVMGRATVLAAEACLALPVEGLGDLRSFVAGHYVDLATGTVAVKTDCPGALAGLTLSGLPRPCTVEISNPVFAPSRYPVTADDLTLSFSQPGTYTVRVLSVPHLPGVFTVEAPGG